jgi:hypothetical protein
MRVAFTTVIASGLLQLRPWALYLTHAATIFKKPLSGDCVVFIGLKCCDFFTNNKLRITTVIVRLRIVLLAR